MARVFIGQWQQQNSFCKAVLLRWCLSWVHGTCNLRVLRLRTSEVCCKRTRQHFAAFEKGMKKYWSRPSFRFREIFGSTFHVSCHHRKSLCWVYRRNWGIAIPLWRPPQSHARCDLSAPRWSVTPLWMSPLSCLSPPYWCVTPLWMWPCMDVTPLTCHPPTDVSPRWCVIPCGCDPAWISPPWLVTPPLMCHPLYMSPRVDVTPSGLSLPSGLSPSMDATHPAHRCNLFSSDLSSCRALKGAR